MLGLSLVIEVKKKLNNVCSWAQNFVWYIDKIILVKFEFDKSTSSRASKGLKFYGKGANYTISPVIS